MQDCALDKGLLDEIMDVARVMSADGKPADYIPELALTPPELFALSCAPAGGETVETGDTERFFTMQSISKTLALAFAVEHFGAANVFRHVFRHVGMEPSADSFNSLMRIEMTSSKPSNPFMNAGAIAVCSLIHTAYRESSAERLFGFFTEITGRDDGFDEKVCASEKRSADRNRALAYFMKSVGLLHGDVESILDFYFKLCSIRCTSGGLAQLGAMFASGGVSPVSGKARDGAHRRRPHEYLRPLQRLGRVRRARRPSRQERRLGRNPRRRARAHGNRRFFARARREGQFARGHEGARAFVRQAEPARFLGRSDSCFRQLTT